MKIRYLNGEKVVVIENFFRSEGKKYNKDIEVYKLAEISEVPSRDFGDSMELALMDISITCNLRVRTISTEDHEVIFDDEKKVKKTKSPRLRLPRCNNSSMAIRGLKIISGGKSSISKI
jgi:hypothetical protein